MTVDDTPVASCKVDVGRRQTDRAGTLYRGREQLVDSATKKGAARGQGKLRTIKP